MESIKDKVIKLWTFMVLFLILFTLLIIRKILSFFPRLFKKVNQFLHKYGPIAKTDYTVEDYADSYTKWSSWKVIWQCVCQSLYENVKQGGKGPNPKVLSQDGATEYNLLDFAKPGRPLVLNFGSCS